MKRIIFLLILILLIGGCDSNIQEELTRFCQKEGFRDYYAIKDHGYENTQVKCADYNFVKIIRSEIYYIYCKPTISCAKYDEWDDCKKPYYNYTCKGYKKSKGG